MSFPWGLTRKDGEPSRTYGTSICVLGGIVTGSTYCGRMRGHLPAKVQSPDASLFEAALQESGRGGRAHHRRCGLGIEASHRRLEAAEIAVAGELQGRPVAFQSNAGSGQDVAAVRF